MITDVNVNLSRWPFRRLPCDEPARLVERLEACGVTQAWAGSFDGLFHKDLGGVNARLAEDCRKFPAGLLRPFGAVNLALPDWREDLRSCHEDYHMPGIRLHPNYHGYRLDDPLFAELLAEAERRGLIVELAIRMEDPRMQHPLMRVPDVDTGPLPALLASRPGLRLVLLNALGPLRGAAITSLVGAGQVYFGISTLEGVGGIGSLLDRFPLERLLFGSHLPYFLLESAILKLQESDLSAGQVKAITRENAARILAK